MWKRSLATAFLVLLSSPALADPLKQPNISVKEIQNSQAKAYPNLKLFDEANHPIPRQRNTSEASVLSPDNHGGKQSDQEREPVELKAPKQVATEAPTGMMAGNPPTSTLLGLTELAYPYQAASHFGPPSQYEYEILFRYTPPPTVMPLDVGKYFGSQAAAESSFNRAPATLGIPLTDSADYINKMTANAKLVDQITSPNRWVKMTEACNQAQAQDMANSSAEAAEVEFAGALTDIQHDLFNVANESGARKPSIHALTRTVDEVAWMVQEAYKRIFLPMALLLILPGAVITQVRSMVGYGFKLKVEVQSPFQGLLRAMIAIFLIPATQLIVSYSIDVGNSMTHAVSAYGLDPRAIMNYADAQLYNPPFKNSANQLTPAWEDKLTRNPALEDKVVFDTNNAWSSILGLFAGWANKILGLFGIGSLFNTDSGSNTGTGGVDGVPVPDAPDPSGGGKAWAVPEGQVQPEKQSRMTVQMQLALNSINMVDCSIVLMLLQFQTAMMCYLMLLGPIAAAFYAWPSTAPFKNAFAGWVDGVVTLALWRFWWCLLLLCLNVRILWLDGMGQYHINSEWEMLVFSAFTMLMSAVPFQPFDFRPGRLVQSVLDKAEKDSKKKAEGKLKSGDIGKRDQDQLHNKAEAKGKREDGSDGERNREPGINPSAPPGGKEDIGTSGGKQNNTPNPPPASTRPAPTTQPSTNPQPPTAPNMASAAPQNVTPPPMTKDTADV